MQGVTYQNYHPPGKKLNYDVVCGVAVSPSPPPPKQSCEVDMTLENLSRPSTTDPQHCFGGRGGAEIDSGPIVVKFLVGLHIKHVHIKHSMHKFWLSDVIPHCAITLVLRYVHTGGAV